MIAPLLLCLAIHCTLLTLPYVYLDGINLWGSTEDIVHDLDMIQSAGENKASLNHYQKIL